MDAAWTLQRTATDNVAEFGNDVCDIVQKNDCLFSVPTAEEAIGAYICDDWTREVTRDTHKIFIMDSSSEKDCLVEYLRCRKRDDEFELTKHLTAQDFKLSTVAIVKLAQREVFSEEIKDLEKRGSVKR